MPVQNPKTFQKSLLQWYWKNAREMPWRKTKDPYKIWVSEIMLQQTQVDTVIPYYERWIKRFPTVKKLSEAPEDDVMKHWAGLGYYRRARMLHQAAKHLCETHKGKLPDRAKELIQIPGIGRYTAGAIASIAFGEKTPVLDGNVIRILSRLTAFKGDVGVPANVEKLWDVATSLVPKKHSGDYNQATMELGATLCTPTNPSCLICPVSEHCVAYHKDSPTRFPVKKQKEKLEQIKTAALILRKNTKVLVQRQGFKQRWGGLWMFPYDKSKEALSKNLSIGSDDFKHRMTVKHGYTKYKIRLDVYEKALSGKESFVAKESAQNDYKWVSVSKLGDYAFPSPHQKIVKDLVKKSG